MLGTCSPFSTSVSQPRETMYSGFFFSAAISWVFFSTSRSVRWRLSRSLFSPAPGDRGLCWLSIVGRSNLPQQYLPVVAGEFSSKIRAFAQIRLVGNPDREIRRDGLPLRHGGRSGSAIGG